MMSVFFGADAKLSLITEAAKKWVMEKYHVESPVCQVATYLYAGAKVIAGHEQALQFIEDNKDDVGIRRTKRIPVAGAFHTPLMESAKDVLKEAISNTTVRQPRILVYSNINGLVYSQEHHVRKYLPRQIVRSCAWEQAMNKMFPYRDEAYMPRTFECGPSANLCGILKKINGKAGRKASHVRA